MIECLGMQLSILPVMAPPMASKHIVAPILAAISDNLSSNSGSEELRIKLAPSLRSTYTCSSFLTMFIISIFSGGIMRLSILPRAEAAASTITVFTFLFLANSRKAIAVKGFTKLMEACQKLNESSTGRHSPDRAIAYWLQDPELMVGVKATFLLRRPHPIRPPPLDTTTPLPSNPGMHGAFLWSYEPSCRKQRSEGLTGAAMTLMRTSPSRGYGIGTSLIVNFMGPSRNIAFIVLASSIKIFIIIDIHVYKSQTVPP